MTTGPPEAAPMEVSRAGPLAADPAEAEQPETARKRAMPLRAGPLAADPAEAEQREATQPSGLILTS